MLGRYWLALVAVGLTLALAGTANAKGVGDNSGSGADAQHTQGKPTPDAPPAPWIALQNDIERIARALEGSNAKPNAATEGKYDKQNADAQTEMASWALPVFLAAIVELILTGIGVVLIYNTLQEQRRSSELQLRPYVGVIRGKYQWLPGQERIIIKVQNSGQTPATYFKIKSAAAGVKRGEQPTKPDKFKEVIWPALGGDDSVIVGIQPEGFSEAARAVLDAQGTLFFYVFGSVTYGDVWGNEYETEFAYFTPNASPTNQEIIGPFDKKKPKNFRKMSRGPGRLKTYQLTKKAKPERRWFKWPN